MSEHLTANMDYAWQNSISLLMHKQHSLLHLYDACNLGILGIDVKIKLNFMAFGMIIDF
jgi:hypothetical protein